MSSRKEIPDINSELDVPFPNVPDSSDDLAKFKLKLQADNEDKQNNRKWSLESVKHLCGFILIALFFLLLFIVVLCGKDGTIVESFCKIGSNAILLILGYMFGSHSCK